MNRRTLLTGLGALLAAPLGVGTQPAQATRHIGVLAHGTAPGRHWQDFEVALRERGWIKERNIAVEYRYSGGKPERLSDLAAELVRLRPDVIVAHTNQAIAAVKGVTTTIPIVMLIAVEPVGAGFVVSLARPGGNVTGVTFDVGEEIWGKRLELLSEAARGINRVAVLWNPAYGPNRNRWTAVEEAAHKLSVALVSVEAEARGDLDSRFALIGKERVRGLFVLGDPVLFELRSQIADLALKYRLPSISPYREAADAGGLIAYGINLAGTWRQAAQYVDKILRGAKPGELPVEQPNTFELVVNVKSAKAMRLTIPPSLLLRADQVID